jgi:hypothetical protein
MSSRIMLALLILGSVGIVAVVGFMRYGAATTRPAHVEIVRDRSDSILSDCNSTASLGKKALADPHMTKGSTVSISFTGDETTAFEPVQGATYEFPVVRKVMDGRGETDKKQEGMLADLRSKCEAAKQTTASPILLATKRAVENLKSKGCGPNSNCTVYVQTDLQETVYKPLKEALRGANKGKETLSGIIDNTGINVVMCGSAETTGLTTDSGGKTRQMTANRDPKSADLLRQVWTNVFTDRQLVSFPPYCPKN